MMEFVLIVYLGAAKWDDSHTFKSFGQCVTLSKELAAQDSIPAQAGNGTSAVRAVCLPVAKEQ